MACPSEMPRIMTRTDILLFLHARWPSLAYWNWFSKWWLCERKGGNVKIFNRANCNGLHNERFFTIRVVKHKRYPERLHTSILGDIQNSKRALATCCTELSKKQDKVNSRGPFQLAQVCDSIEVMTSLNLKKYFHTYQKI